MSLQGIKNKFSLFKHDLFYRIAPCAAFVTLRLKNAKNVVKKFLHFFTASQDVLNNLWLILPTFFVPKALHAKQF